MEVPTTYSQWANLLDKFGAGDNTAIEEMNNGSFVIDAGTASRFYARVEEVYKKRKQSWLDKFKQSFQFQNFRTEDDLEIALQNGKQSLYPLSKFAAIKGLPEDLTKVLKTDIESFVDEIKKSLKESISKTSSGREKMLILLSKFELNNIPQKEQIDKKSEQKHTTETTPSATGRKIIF